MIGVAWAEADAAAELAADGTALGSAPGEVLVAAFNDGDGVVLNAGGIGDAAPAQPTATAAETRIAIGPARRAVSLRAAVCGFICFTYVRKVGRPDGRTYPTPRCMAVS